MARRLDEERAHLFQFQAEDSRQVQSRCPRSRLEPSGSLKERHADPKAQTKEDKDIRAGNIEPTGRANQETTQAGRKNAENNRSVWSWPSIEPK
jgi:hypothetical protein